jgi:1,4-dihydroxy-2-naphthoate octaprenyltransferase
VGVGVGVGVSAGEGEGAAQGGRAGAGFGVWLAAARPRTWAAAIGPIAVGTAAAGHEGAARPLLALGALVAVLLLQIGVNLANDAEDFERGADTAERLGPIRATQAGLLSGRAVKRAAVGCFLASSALGLALSVAGGPWILALGLVSVLFGYLYTGGPWPLAYHGLGDLLALTFFGLVAVTGTALLQAGRVPAVAWIAWVPVGALATAILVCNNLRDRHTDEKAGKRTLAVRIGAAATRAEYVLLLLAAFATPLVLWLSGRAGAPVLASWLALPAAIQPLRTVLHGDGRALNGALAGTARLELLFCLLFAGGLVW